MQKAALRREKALPIGKGCEDELAEQSLEFATEATNPLLQVEIIKTPALFSQGRLAFAGEMFETLKCRIREILNLVLNVFQKPAHFAPGFVLPAKGAHHQGDSDADSKRGKHCAGRIIANAFVDGSARGGILRAGFRRYFR